MKNENSIIAVITSVITVAVLTSAALIICKKLLDKKYFTVSE